MDDNVAAERFAALSHPTRLRIFRTLMEAGPQGLAAGALAETLAVAPNNLSAHLSTLIQAELLQVRRDGRSRIYAVNLSNIGETVSFLLEDCCQGHPEVCNVIAPLAKAAC